MSTARTSTRCEPRVRTSTWLMKLPVMAGGPLVIVVSGGLVSSGSTTSHSYSVGIAVGMPNGPIAWAWNSCPPSSRCVYVFGDSHGSNGRPSIEQVTNESGWSTKNSKVAALLLLTGGGPETIETNGATPWVAAAMAKIPASPLPMLASAAQTCPVNGLLVVVTSIQPSAPSACSSRIERVGKSPGS